MVPEVRGASGSGSQRLYSFRDILILKVIKRLIDAGISLQQIRTAIDHLRARGVADLTQVTLMSDGVSVFECTSDDEVIDLLRGGQGVFGIALGGVWRRHRGHPVRAAGRAGRGGRGRRRPTTSCPSAAGPAPPAERVSVPASRPSIAVDSERCWNGARESPSRSTGRGSMAPKGQHPRNLSGTKTAYARQLWSHRVTEGECARRERRARHPAYARK